MLKTNLIKKLGSVTIAAALLISSQTFTFAQEETFTYPTNIAASWDFSKATNSGFIVRDFNGYPKTIELSDGQGKMYGYDSYIITRDNYLNAVLEFDYKLTAANDNEIRNAVYFGVAEGENQSSNFVYIDFDKTNGGKLWFIVGGESAEYDLKNDYTFYQNTVYTFRYVISADSLQIWAKSAEESEYTYVGEKTDLNIPRGKISIFSNNYGFIDNLKIYSDMLKVSVNDGDRVSADNAKFNVTLFNDAEITESNVMLKQNGSVIACSFEQNGKNLIITPSALEANESYTLWFSEEVSGEKGGRTISFTTLPEVAAYYDFATPANSGFDVKNSSGADGSIGISDGKGGLWWDSVLVTKNSYQNPVLDFDFSYDHETDTDSNERLFIYFGVENFTSNYYSYIDFNDAGNAIMHFVAAGGDYTFIKGNDFEFKKKTGYSIRYIIETNCVKLYAKETTDTAYTYVGEVTGDFSIPVGQIKIWGQRQYTNATSIKVYANTTKISVKDGATVSADLKEIKVTLPSETTVDNTQFKLTQNGNKVGYTYTQNGNVLTIKPILKPQKEYVLYLSYAITGEADGITVTFNTMPSLSAYYDFTQNVNSGFATENLGDISGGEGTLEYNTTITTTKSYESVILDFDYRTTIADEHRLNVSFGDNNFAYIGFTANGGYAHFVANGGDDVYKNGTDFWFEQSTAYSMRFVVSNNTVEFYAKKVDAENYTYVGNRTGVNIGKFTIKFSTWGGGLIKNLNVYGYVADNYDYAIKNATYDSATNKFTADIISATATGAKAAVASYSENNGTVALNDVKIVDIDSTEKSVDTTLEAGDEYKVMVFDALSITPVAESVEFN